MPSLERKQVLVVRSKEQTEDTRTILQQNKVDGVFIPTVSFVPPLLWDRVDDALTRLHFFDLLLFTSQNAVRFFFERAKEKSVQIIPHNWRVAAIGPVTAQRIRSYGIEVDIVPEKPGAQEEMGEALSQALKLKGLKILYPRAERAREVLPEVLLRKGAKMETVPCYRTVPSEEGRGLLEVLIKSSRVDWIVFASSSQVHAFMDLCGTKRTVDWIKKEAIKLAVIGRITENALSEYEVSASVVASTPNIEALIAAMK